MSKLICRSLAGFLFIQAAATSTAPAFDGPGDELAAYYAGNGFLQRGLYDMAIKEYRSFLAGHEDHEKAATARYGLAVALFKSGKLEEAEQEARTITDPKFPFAVELAVMRGQCAMTAGHAGEAVSALRDVIQKHRDHKLAADASALLIEALYKLKRLDEVVKTGRDSLARWPTGAMAPRIQILLAYALFDQGKGHDAAEVLDQILIKGDSKAQTPGALQLRGRIWLDEKAYDKAFSAFERAAKSPELAEECSYWMAKCELRRGQFARAASRLDAAIKSHPKGALAAEMSYDLSVALVRSGAGEKAVAELKQFPDRFPEHVLKADAMELLASTLHQAGKYDESAKICRQFLKQFPDQSKAAAITFIGAENEFLQDRMDEAERGYRQFLERFDKDERADLARFRLGLVLLRAKKPGEASEFLEAAAKSAGKDPRLVSAVIALANLRFDRGEWKAASEGYGAYLGAAKDAADLDEAILKLGLCEARQGHNEAAIGKFDELTARFPKSPQVVQATFERGQALLALGKLKEASECFEGLLARSADSR
ncbi:MAG TPA: tetratricopeptide repeat protein, partial [Phycisphaerae bacterium]|nr:tetratricopeptide repeat protein [Phycisphaerae bacterium]